MFELASAREHAEERFFAREDMGFDIVVAERLIAQDRDAFDFDFVVFADFEDDVFVAVFAVADLGVDLGEEEAFVVVISLNFFGVVVNFIDIERRRLAEVDFFLQIVGIDFVVPSKRNRRDRRFFFEVIGEDVFAIDSVEIDLNIVVELHAIESFDVFADDVERQRRICLLFNIVEQVFVGVSTIAR